MMTSKKHEQTLCSLLFKTTPDYNNNLQTLLTLLKNSQEGSILVAPEVCLTGFDYDNFEGAVEFSKIAIEEIKKASLNKTIILTMFEKVDGSIFNNAKIFHNGKVIFTRAKARLFRFGGEDKYMSEGSDDSFELVEVDGVKIAIIICFELRFRELLKKCEGADIIAVPSWWGVLRSEHFKSLTQSLAIMNQCYVVASDSQNEECSKLSGIISPKGEVKHNGNTACLEEPYSKKEITLMRRYIDVGIE